MGHAGVDVDGVTPGRRGIGSRPIVHVGLPRAVATSNSMVVPTDAVVIAPVGGGASPDDAG
jgi:hypothetical protein